VPGRPDLPTFRRRTNRNAIVAFVTGLIGLSVVALGFGISALSQIRDRRLERGRTLAWIGLVTGGAWLVVTIVAVSRLMPTDAPGNSLGVSMGHRFPGPGECFDVYADGEQRKRDCTQPHDAEMVLAFELPEQDWPGKQEIDRMAGAACDKRLLDRYKTRMPIEDGESMYFAPAEDVWAVGDRRVACAIAAEGSGKLTAPIGPAPSQHRVPDELEVGDCFTEPRRDKATVTLAACNFPHDAQLTHRFELPDGPFEEKSLKRKAEDGCEAVQNKMFAKRRSPVPIDNWYLHPSAETWGNGDRLVLCYVVGKGRSDLNRSVIPD
jgi:hypothetical protein